MLLKLFLNDQVTSIRKQYGELIAKNEVEKKGISLALSKSKESDLNIIMIDNTSIKINKEIRDLLPRLNSSFK